MRDAAQMIWSVASNDAVVAQNRPCSRRRPTLSTWRAFVVAVPTLQKARLAGGLWGAGFTLQAQATGKGPLANITDHLDNPFGNNIATNMCGSRCPHHQNYVSVHSVHPNCPNLDLQA